MSKNKRKRVKIQNKNKMINTNKYIFLYEKKIYYIYIILALIINIFIMIIIKFLCRSSTKLFINNIVKSDFKIIGLCFLMTCIFVTFSGWIIVSKGYPIKMLNDGKIHINKNIEFHNYIRFFIKPLHNLIINIGIIVSIMTILGITGVNEFTIRIISILLDMFIVIIFDDTIFSCESIFKKEMKNIG